MSVVKKLQTGGAVQKESLEDYIAKELETNKFTANAEKTARNVASNWVKFSNSPDFQKALKFDKIKGVYTIDPNQISDESLKTVDWEGDENISGKNLFGQYSGTDVKKYNSLIGSWVSKYMGALPQNTSPLTEGQEKDIPDIGEYMTKTLYGGKENALDLMSSDFESLKTDDERKQKLLSAAKSNVSQYLEDYAKNQNSGNFKNVQTVKELQEILNTGDWDTFKNKSMRIGWDVNQFLLKDDEKKALAETELKNKSLQSEEHLKSLGITDTTFLEQLKNAGFTTVDNDFTPMGWENQSWFKEHLKSQNAIVLKNPAGKHIIVKDNALFDQKFDTPFKPNYGYAWQNEEAGGVKFYNPSQSLSGKLFGEDPYASQNIGRELDVEIPGYEGWSAYGWSDDVKGSAAADVLGRRDFMAELVLEKDGKRIRFFKQSDSTYKSEDGKITLPNVQPKGFGKNTISIQDINKTYAPQIEAKRPYTIWNSGGIKYRNREDLEEFLTDVETTISDNQAPKLSHLENLKDIVINPKYYNVSPEQINRIKTVLKKYTNTSNTTPINKNGGVLFLQRGYALNRIKTTTETKEKQNPVESVNTKLSKSGTVYQLLSGKGDTEDYLKAIGTAADIAAFVPGAGGVAGTISFAANLAADLSDGQVNNVGEHFTNAGFAALGFVGLGGLKNALKLTKVVKGSDKVIDVAKAVEKIKETKAVVDVKRIKELEKLATKLGNGAKEADIVQEIGKLAGSGKNSAKIAKEITEDLGKVIASASKKGWVGKSADFVGKYGKKALDSNYIKYGTAGAVAIPGAQSAYNIGEKVITGQGGDITLEDIGNVAQTAYLGRNLYKNIQATKAINRQTVKSGTEDSIEFTAGGKKLQISGEDLPSRESVKLLSNPLNRGKAKEANLTKFKEDLANRYNTLNPNSPINAADIDEKTISALEKARTTGLTLAHKPSMAAGQNIVKARKEWELAKKAIEGGKGNIMQVIRPKNTAKIDRPSFVPKSVGKKQPVPTIEAQPSIIKKAKVKKQIPQVANKEQLDQAGTPKKAYNKKNVLPKKESSKNKKGKQEESASSAMLQLGGTLKNYFLPTTGKFSGNAVTNAIKLKLNKPSAIPQAVSKAPVFKTDFTKQPISPEILGTQEGGITSKNLDWSKIGKGIGTFAKNIDSTDVVNAGLYLEALRTNKESTNSQKNAVLAGIVNETGPAKLNYRVVNTTSPIYAKQAAQVQSSGNRIARSTSDIDKANSIQLEAANKAAQLNLQGDLVNMENLEKQRAIQFAQDAQYGQTSAAIANANKARIADALGKTHLLDANKIAANYNSLQNLVHAANQNRQIKQSVSERQKLYNLTQNPQLKELYDKYSKEIGNESIYKKEFEEKVSKDINLTDRDWNTSKARENWAKNLKGIQESMKPLLDQIEAIQTQHAYGIPSRQWKYAKGGSLIDKVALEEVKQENKKELQQEKQFYITILKNNELMQKSLIKVFK